MSESLLTLAAATGALLGIAAVIALAWRVMRYTVRAHDELLGTNGTPGVRASIEKLDTDMRARMAAGEHATGVLSADMNSRSATRDSQWQRLTERIEELFSMIRKG